MKEILITLFLILSTPAGAIQNGSAPPRVMDIPYYPSGAEHLTRKDRRICIARAQIAAQTLRNAKTGFSQKTTRTNLSKFLMSRRFVRLDLPLEEVTTYNKILDFAYEVNKKFPAVTPRQLGDRIYSSCVYQKSAILV